MKIANPSSPPTMVPTSESWGRSGSRGLGGGGVKRGKGIGGSFQHVPACRSATQLGCVIAFSTFDQPPPANSLFGRTNVSGDQVLCTNPAALRGGGQADGKAALRPTPWPRSLPRGAALART